MQRKAVDTLDNREKIRFHLRQVCSFEYPSVGVIDPTLYSIESISLLGEFARLMLSMCKSYMDCVRRWSKDKAKSAIVFCIQNDYNAGSQ